jgi:hypothetical protein
MTGPVGDLAQQSEEFGQEMAGLLIATLPGLPTPPLQILTRGTRTVIRPPERPERLPLYVQGVELASLELSVALQLDSFGQWLAVERSTYGLYAKVDRAPVLRIDYRRDMNKVPSAHVQVHGHRGALSHLLSQAGHATPHDMASLHIPVGGARFRPCLEDFIQFLIAECKFDAKTRQWRHHVEAGRARWRLRQAGAIARDLPEVAASELRALGYEVTKPSAPLPESSPKVLRNW